MNYFPTYEDKVEERKISNLKSNLKKLFNEALDDDFVLAYSADDQKTDLSNFRWRWHKLTENSSSLEAFFRTMNSNSSKIFCTPKEVVHIVKDYKKSADEFSHENERTDLCFLVEYESKMMVFQVEFYNAGFFNSGKIRLFKSDFCSKCVWHINQGVEYFLVEPINSADA